MNDIHFFLNKTVYPLDENGQPVFTLDMDAQRRAVFKVFDPFILLIITIYLGLSRRREC